MLLLLAFLLFPQARTRDFVAKASAAGAGAGAAAAAPFLDAVTPRAHRP